MTGKEHALQMAMFTKHAQFIKIILDILKSRGLAKNDDLAAFEYAAIVDNASNSELTEQTTALYFQVAKDLGVTIDPST